MHNDNEMGLHCKYPIVLRRKEIRKEERIDDKDKVETKWHLAPKGDTKFFGTIKLGDFKIQFEESNFLEKLIKFLKVLSVNLIKFSRKLLNLSRVIFSFLLYFVPCLYLFIKYLNPSKISFF